MASWSKEFVLEFIEEFRGHPSIWKVKSKEYHNHEMKESAYSILTEKVKTIDPQANKENVLKKINNLRSSFRKERKKVLMAKKSGRLEDCDCGMQPAGLSARVWGRKGRGQTVSFTCKVDRKAKLCVYGGPK
ncbi:hypothetical protein L798_05974 [Zootermopsis nevadensis]|uniref:MADF domain-containing protein n=1 Tax=Zootermopsis nevadensis TaxID=136037 RepID=A0A067QEU1_ZOONE|nr:hypothetical protein L798_05974 [Zootermopsis nevadensis]